MRQKFQPQLSLLDSFAEHQIGKELFAISQILDQRPEIYDLAAKDLIRANLNDTGRQGLTVESVVRCAILKQYRQLGYEELAFHLEDSKSFEAFARLRGAIPKKSVLQKTITLIKPETWEQINHILLEYALVKKIENGKKVRIDSTVTETNIHKPSDSSLLKDAVRIMVRLLQEARNLDGAPPIEFCCRLRRASRRAQSIPTARKHRQIKYYRELVKITKEQLHYLLEAEQALLAANHWDLMWEAWYAATSHFIPLILQVIEQTERRVFNGEQVPVSEKICSLFEPHTDIIVKGFRDVQFGHKLNLTSGKSGLILDAVVEKGNPADSVRLIPMLERQEEIYGCVPERAVADGGYASNENLTRAKLLGVRDMVFHKKRGIRIEDMVKSKWVYRQLKSFRAGIEANISCLKRIYGLGRCLWRGFEKFKAHVWSSIVTYNLHLMARILIRPG